MSKKVLRIGYFDFSSVNKFSVEDFFKERLELAGFDLKKPITRYEDPVSYHVIFEQED